jgi:hypothetical protein
MNHCDTCIYWHKFTLSIFNRSPLPIGHCDILTNIGLDDNRLGWAINQIGPYGKENFVCTPDWFGCQEHVLG